MTNGGDLRHARIYLALGELPEAEREVGLVLEQTEGDRDAMRLLAKIKHIRGELSAAVTYWAQLQATTPPEVSARQHIAMLLQLAHNPVRHAGELVALGGGWLVRKPMAYLELQGAFQLFLTGMPAEARAHCAEVARRYREVDRTVYKLAIMTDAWICQQLGALEQACAILEQLGREASFEHDVDRILSVATLYQRIGTPERLRAAVNIHRYLESSPESVSSHGQLARLRRQLGDVAGAAHHETLHLSAFRRSMDRIDRHEAALAAAERYVPLFRLREGKFDEPADPTDNLARRPRALFAALDDELASARKLLARGDDLLDHRYSADVDLLLGQRGRGTAAHLEALQRTTSLEIADMWVVGWILDAQAREPDAAVQRFFAEPAMAERISSELARTAGRHPTDPRPWRWLAQLYRLLQRDDEATRMGERATALQRGLEQRRRPIGRVLSSAVYYFGGEPRGIVHELWASRERTPEGEGGGLSPDDVHGNLTAEMLANVRNVFVAVREYARARFPHLTADLDDHRYSFKVTKEDEESGGLSAGLPTALAFLSVFLQRPCSQEVAATGVVVADAHDVLAVAGVGDIVHKVRAAYDRELERIVLPAANRPAVEGTPLVPRPVIENMVSYVATLEDAMRIVFDPELFG